MRFGVIASNCASERTAASPVPPGGCGGGGGWGGGALPTGLGRHRCAFVPLQLQSWTFVPSAVPEPATSTHFPLFGLCSSLSCPDTVWIKNCCAAVPLHVQSWMLVPSAVPAPLTSRHLPELGLTSRDRPPPTSSTRHTCAPVPLHVHSCTFVPSAVPPPFTSRHLPGLASAPKVYVPAPRSSAIPVVSSTDLPEALHAETPASAVVMRANVQVRARSSGRRFAFVMSSSSWS